MDIAAISPVASASFVQPAFTTSTIDSAAGAIQQTGVSDTAAVSQSAPAAPAAATTDARSVRDILFDFLQQNLFQSLLTPTALSGNSIASPLAVTDILLQELLASRDNRTSNFSDLTQLFSTFNQFTTSGRRLNTFA